MPTLTSVNAQWTNSIAVPDADLRRNDAASFLGDGTSLGARGGIVRHGDNSLLVTVNGSDQITVQPGVVVVPSSTALAGAYTAAFSSVTGPGAGTAIATRNATNPRIDLVIVDISSGQARIRTVDGTPSSSPSAPALPAGSIELGRLNVPATGGGAVTVNSTFRTYAAALGGTLYVEVASQLPGSGNQKGQRAVALDTGLIYTWSGTDWVMGRNPGGALGYAQAVAAQNTITTIADLTNLSVAVTVGANRRIRVSAQVPFRDAGGSSVTDTLYVREGATTLQESVAGNLGANEFADASISAILTPSAGAHTYKLSAAAGSGTINMVASATKVAFILVEDIGAA